MKENILEWPWTAKVYIYIDIFRNNLRCVDMCRKELGNEWPKEETCCYSCASNIIFREWFDGHWALCIGRSSCLWTAKDPMGSCRWIDRISKNRWAWGLKLQEGVALQTGGSRHQATSAGLGSTDCKSFHISGASVWGLLLLWLGSRWKNAPRSL